MLPDLDNSVFNCRTFEPFSPSYTCALEYIDTDKAMSSVFWRTRLMHGHSPQMFRQVVGHQLMSWRGIIQTRVQPNVSVSYSAWWDRCPDREGWGLVEVWKCPWGRSREQRPVRGETGTRVALTPRNTQCGSLPSRHPKFTRKVNKDLNLYLNNY